jgi:hypothetical protein
MALAIAAKKPTSCTIPRRSAGNHNVERSNGWARSATGDLKPGSRSECWNELAHIWTETQDLDQTLCRGVRARASLQGIRCLGREPVSMTGLALSRAIGFTNADLDPSSITRSKRFAFNNVATAILRKRLSTGTP